MKPTLLRLKYMRLVDVQSNLVNKDTEEAVRIKRVKFRENVRTSFPRDKQTVRNNEVSIFSGCP